MAIRAPTNDTAVIVLAAGASRRLGHPKQLVDWQGSPLVRHAARIALSAQVGPVLVVLGARREEIVPALEGLDLQVVLNSQWAEGLGSSIGAGVRAARGRTPPPRNVILMPCDQPHATADHLRRLVGLLDDGTGLAGTSYADTIGVPAIFHRSFFDQLEALEGDRGAQGILRGHPDAPTAPLAAAALDIDTPEDLAGLET